MSRLRPSLSFSKPKPPTTAVVAAPARTTSYPNFAEIPAGQNPANWVLINGRYYFNDYDTTGNYLRSQFAR